MLTREVVAEAAGIARSRFLDRRTPMTFELYDEGKIRVGQREGSG